MDEVKMTNSMGQPARVRSCRVTEYLKLKWTMGWSKENETKDVLRIAALEEAKVQTETADQLDAEEEAGNQEVPVIPEVADEVTEPAE